MASLLTVLKKIGKDLSDVEVWVKEGVAIAGPIVGAIDPPLAPIIAIVEQILNALPTGTVPTVETVAALVRATAMQGTVCACCKYSTKP